MCQGCVRDKNCSKSKYYFDGKLCKYRVGQNEFIGWMRDNGVRESSYGERFCQV